jgi:hypothetical protein
MTADDDDDEDCACCDFSDCLLFADVNEVRDDDNNDDVRWTMLRLFR